MFTRHYLGPGFGVCRDCFDSLTDGRSYERCEGAGKTALGWECELLYNQNRVRSCSGISAVQSCRKYRNRLLLPYLYCLYNSLAVSYQMRCMSGIVGVSPISVSPSDCLFGRFHLAEDVIAETFAG